VTATFVRAVFGEDVILDASDAPRSRLLTDGCWTSRSASRRGP